MMAWRGQNCVGRSFDFGMLSRVTTLATQSVTSGVQTAAMVTGMAAVGGAQGLMQGRAAGGGFGSLSKLGMLAGSGMAGMGDSMGKEFENAGSSMGGVTGFLKQHLGGGPAGGQTTMDSFTKSGASSDDGSSAGHSDSTDGGSGDSGE